MFHTLWDIFINQPRN